MAELTEPVTRLIAHPGSSKVLSTVSPEGEPHSVVCGSLAVTDDGLLVMGEVFMHRAAEYLRTSPRVEFLVWKGRDAYSIKAIVKERCTSGPVFDRMTDALDRMGMTAVAVWTFEPLEVWDESASRTAGDRVIRWRSPDSGA